MLLAVFAIFRVGCALGGFRLLARLRLGAFARRGRLSAVCSGFGVFHVHSFWGIAPCSDFCLSRVVCRSSLAFIRVGQRPLSWKYCYPLPAGSPLIYPTENTFGGDPDRSPLKGNPPFRGKPDAIDALRSNRYTFGAARRDWRGAQQSLDLRFGHFYPLSYTRSENERASR